MTRKKYGLDTENNVRAGKGTSGAQKIYQDAQQIYRFESLKSPKKLFKMGGGRVGDLYFRS